MSDKPIPILGLFAAETQAAEAISALKQSPWKLEKVYSPIPGHHLEAALDLPQSKVGWYTLCGGIIGFFTGFLLAAFTANRWELIVSGKPIIALVPFFIVGFEFTILFAVFGNVVGLITQMKLPQIKSPKYYDSRTTGDRFGVLATCPESEQDKLTNFFTTKGGEIRTFEAT